MALITRVRLRGLALLGVLFIFCGIHSAHAKEEIRVLVLLSLDVTYPYVKSKVDGLAFEGARNSEAILLDIQTLEDQRFTDKDKLDRYYQRKAEQLKSSNPDVIAITGSPVIFSFYNDYVYPLMPDVPMVGETRSIPKDHKPPAYSFIEYLQNMPKTIDMALKLHKASTVYLIGDATHPGSRLSMELVGKAVAERADVKIERLDMPFKQLVETVRKLPKDAVGFFSLIFSDGKGKRMVPETALQMIADQAPFPIFAFHETMVGSGATGGIVAKGEDVGIQMIKESMLALKSGPFNPPRVVPAVSTVLFDWDYMDRYGVSVHSLPGGAEVINLKPGVWDEYFYELLIAIFVLIIQSILVALLTLYSRQKKQLSAELVVINDELEQRIRRRTRSLEELNQALQKKEVEITLLMLTDSLTGIANRRHFESEAEREFQRSARSHSNLCIGICDIDYFKAVNDSFGHDVGDIVLARTAQCISENIRASDFVARWGGDEFVIMCVDSDCTAAETTAERVRSAVNAIQYEEMDKSVAISMGISQRREGDSFDDVMKRADQALYQAKGRGRNCIASM